MKVCPYCREALSRKDAEKDHLPPQGIFPDLKPQNLITVLCCPGCHDLLSDGDEPLAVMVGTGLSRTDKVKDLTTRANRSLKKGSWFRDSLREAALQAEPRLGMLNGKLDVVYSVKLSGDGVSPAINTSLVRIAKGLIFKRNPEWDSRNYRFRVCQFDETNPWKSVRIFAELGTLQEEVIKDVEVFVARWGWAIDKPEYGVFVMTFYGGLHFAIFMSPNDQPEWDQPSS
jgi:hypothetical protein